MPILGFTLEQVFWGTSPSRGACSSRPTRNVYHGQPMNRAVDGLLPLTGLLLNSVSTPRLVSGGWERWTALELCRAIRPIAPSWRSSCGHRFELWRRRLLGRSWNAHDRPRAVAVCACAGSPVPRLNPFAVASLRAPHPRTRTPRIDCRNVPPLCACEKGSGPLAGPGARLAETKACTSFRGASAGVSG